MSDPNSSKVVFPVRGFKNSVPAGYEGGSTPLDKLTETGLADEFRIQITGAGMDKLGFLPSPRKEEEVNASQIDMPPGVKIFSNEGGVRFDRFLKELEENGFMHEQSFWFKKVKRNDPTASVRFTRITKNPIPLAQNVRDLLMTTVFDGLWLYGNPAMNPRRDCANCYPTKGSVFKPVRVMSFDGPTKGTYRLDQDE